MEFDSLAFSSALRQRRSVDLRIDIREAAKQIGVSAATLSRLENNKMPDLMTYFLCCKWIGANLDCFFKSYYYLKKGEIIQDGDEVEVSAKYNDPPKWVPVL